MKVTTCTVSSARAH